MGLLLTILYVPKNRTFSYDPNVCVFPDHLRKDEQKGVQILVLQHLGTDFRVYRSGKAKEADRQRSSLEQIVSMMCGPSHSSLYRMMLPHHFQPNTKCFRRPFREFHLFPLTFQDQKNMMADPQTGLKKPEGPRRCCVRDSL